MTPLHTSPVLPHLVDLLEPCDPALVGGKAAPLAQASAAGFDVPRGFVVTTAAPDAPDGLSSWLDALGSGPFAVRSSALSEDALDRSFAGQLETLLSVPKADVPAAIARCRASARSVRALAYAGSEGAGPVAVIIQEMVDATAAGVAFSADPTSGERGVAVVEAVSGVAEALVSGEVTAEAWRVAGASIVRVRSPGSPVLDPSAASRIASLASSLEALFGKPQDIEWALAGPSLRLLQSRPITALPPRPRPIALAIPPGTWERDDHHAVLSPLGWSWFAAYPKALAREMRAILPVQQIKTANIGGHLYTQMVMEGGDGPVPPRWVLWLVTRLLPSMRKANRDCVALLDGEAYMATIDRWEQQGRAAFARATDALFDEAPHALSEDALLARIGQALDHASAGLDLHATLHGPGFYALGKLALFVEDELRWHPNRAFDLVAGSSPKTTELHRSVEAIVAEHEAELAGAPVPRTWGELFDRAPAMASALSSWLSQNRLRILHYDPKHPTLGEQPGLLLTIAAGILEGRRLGSQGPAAPSCAALEEARGLLTPARFSELERLRSCARRGYALRDENGIETVSRPSGLLRHYVLELGRRLPLDSPSHAVYLRVDEHRPALRGELADIRERIEQRRGEEAWATKNRGPRLHGTPPAPMPPLDPFPTGLRQMMRMFGWMMQAEAMPDASDGDAVLRGVGIGARIVTARARVVERPDELASLKHGEVMVCRITSPEWSIALGRVAAIVTDEGALLSHPAIIAREYGVTAVVGTSLATRRIKTGDRVRVDPVEGTVAVVEAR